MSALKHFPCEKQKEILEKLFAPLNQQRLSLRKLLQQAGLSDPDCLHIFDAKNNSELLNLSAQFQKHVNTDGTPTFFINGQEIENIPTLKELESLICEELKSLK